MNNEVTIPEIKEYMHGFTLEPYNYTDTPMKVYIPMLQPDMPGNIEPLITGLNQDIFKSQENIKIPTTVGRLRCFEVPASYVWTATFKTLEWDPIPFPHFPKGSRVMVFIPNKKIEEMMLVPFMT